MNSIKLLMAALLMGTFSLTLAGCPKKDTPAENAVEEVTDTVEEATDDAGDAVEEATEEVTEEAE